LTITATLTKTIEQHDTLQQYSGNRSNFKNIFMKILRHILLLTLLTQYLSLQAQDTTNTKVSFVTKINIQHATKDGIYLNGYVVNIPYDELQKLNGKTVRISGKVTIVKGLKHYNDDVERQGRQEDTKHILKPKIKIVDS
jgi:hypothetical protein